ncbi:hypothetical protein DRF62_02260 [Chryseobacterium piscium]|uniref:Uncharacterized protein n=1 Tax=Chryseobacterium piscium TaxID=333702 RepID=A0A3D9BUH1_9FLAO|nr:hypothetical protein [Chryseobacterium piscium]REC57001.1 hypothetical protein DRF62_02260 [Chryseobacterium piscium]
MEIEAIIIGIVVILVFVGFENTSIKGYKRIIAKQEKLINEQSDFIKVLERDYDIVIQKQFENIRNKINGK